MSTTIEDCCCCCCCNKDVFLFRRIGNIRFITIFPRFFLFLFFFGSTMVVDAGFILVRLIVVGLEEKEEEEEDVVGNGGGVFVERAEIEERGNSLFFLCSLSTGVAGTVSDGVVVVCDIEPFVVLSAPVAVVVVGCLEEKMVVSLGDFFGDFKGMRNETKNNAIDVIVAAAAAVIVVEDHIMI